MSNKLADLLAERGRLVADGGMGTSLFELGLQAGSTPELWNVEHPDLVAKVHAGFIEAGADIVLTNTFGGTRARLDLDNLGDRVAELNRAGVRVARQAAEQSPRQVIVAGSVGPTGQLFEPLGELTHERGVELFTEQVTALAAAGADVIWIETLSSAEELAAAVEAAETTGLPIVTTMSFDTHGKTMMGLAPGALAGWWADHDGSPMAMGANCGVGPADVVMAVNELHAAAPEAVIVAKANCGVPQMIDGTLWYPTSSDDMSLYAELALDAGARIVGACCGSIPDHIAQIRAIVDTHEAREGVERSEIAARLGGSTATIDGGEATGRSRERRSRRRQA
ncbi:MAG: betaine--homocysteine S-methyltransferase [Acidimicrobiia bacterium]|jgi:5-methyltetrahydrofolate--homocysteine methyltransferase